MFKDEKYLTKRDVFDKSKLKKGSFIKAKYDKDIEDKREINGLIEMVCFDYLHIVYLTKIGAVAKETIHVDELWNQLEGGWILEVIE